MWSHLLSVSASFAFTWWQGRGLTRTGVVRWHACYTNIEKALLSCDVSTKVLVRQIVVQKLRLKVCSYSTASMFQCSCVAVLKWIYIYTNTLSSAVHVAVEGNWCFGNTVALKWSINTPSYMFILCAVFIKYNCTVPHIYLQMKQCHLYMSELSVIFCL